MESAMDGEELPYPGLGYTFNEKVFLCFRELTKIDEDIFNSRVGQMTEAQYAFDEIMDLVVMHARTSCAGVKPAMKNLAVFLKYS